MDAIQESNTQCQENTYRWRNGGDDDNEDAQTSVGGSNDGGCALSLTQEAEDRRAEPRVPPREFGSLRRGGGLPVALLQ
jgi:hypothetical protein